MYEIFLILASYSFVRLGIGYYAHPQTNAQNCFTGDF